MTKQTSTDSKVDRLLDGRILARVHAHESDLTLGGDACCHDLTNKGSVSDIDPDLQY